MKWRQPADKNVVDAVVAMFVEPAWRLRERLAVLSARQWERSYYWLDASGMALYLLDRVERLDLQGDLPAQTLARLRQNRADNRERSRWMYAEFLELNREFQQAGIDYCNLKGFTLSPDSCPDPVLRCQLDFDFLVDGKDLDTCRQLLERRGYALRGVTNTDWEFKSGTDELADIANHYQPRRQRCVELHFACDETTGSAPIRDERLNRLIWRRRKDIEIPVLTSVDQFIGQATHLFGHLCGACTRLAWLLEFRNHIDARANGHQFWSELQERIAADKKAALAIGVVCALAIDLFRAHIPAGLELGTTVRLPERVALWVERYGRRALLADFPGTKLNLLLREQINVSNPHWGSERRTALLPLHRAPRIVHVEHGAGVRKRVQSEIYQLRFEMFRVRFHVVEGLRYLVETVKWRRYLRSLRAKRQHPATKPLHTAAKN